MKHIAVVHVPSSGYTAKTEVCIPYLGYAPCNSEVVKYIPLELQGAYQWYGIHTSVFTVYWLSDNYPISATLEANCIIQVYTIVANV